jgi:hypothetical protein
MNAEIHLQWTEDTVARAQEHFLITLSIGRRWLIGQRWLNWIGFGVAFMLFLPCVIFGPGYYITWLLALVVAFSLAQLFLWPWLRKRGIHNSFRKFGEYTQTYTVTDAAFHVKNPYGQGAVPWCKFEKLHRFDDMWLLFITKAVYYILPVDEMKGEVGDFIISKVRENGGKVK